MRNTMTESKIIPKPKHIEYDEGVFSITSETGINCCPGTEKIAKYFSAKIGLDLKIVDKEQDNSIVFILTDNADPGKEGYILDISEKKIIISAEEPVGIFYGIQSLLQLLPVELFGSDKPKELVIAAQTVIDSPDFSWRGLHLDVARHFMPVEFIKKFIDLLAIHKMNILHWHLTEDQGWRIEIKKYPKLTEIGAWRKGTIVGHSRDAKKSGNFEYDGIPHGGFYSQEEIKDIVEYAAERFVTIVPEIDMPGHMQAAIAAYPELGCTGEKLEVKKEWGVNKNILNPEDSTVRFMQDVLKEVLQLFPGKFIHIGGDEAPKDQWENNERYQKLREERGLKDMHEMQSWFIRQMDSFLTENGRRLIGWDEILEGGLAPGAAVMSWRGKEGGINAAHLGHEVVMANKQYTYFDYYQGDKETEPLAIGGDLPLEKVYKFNPVPSELNDDEKKYILGGQGQLWTEYMKTPEHVEYMTYPRATALAEILWNQNDKDNYVKFLERLKMQLKRFDHLKVNYRKLDVTSASN